MPSILVRCRGRSERKLTCAFVPTYIACDWKELHANFEIHKELGSHLGGVHFELTGDNVTGTVQLRPIPRAFLASGG